MNEQPNNRKTLNDDQMDQLLSSFYQMEMPSKLDRLPSSWPQLAVAAATTPTRSVTMVSMSSTASKTFASDGGTYRSGPSMGRRAVVAVASLAACLAVIVASNFSKPVSEATIPVSSGTAVSTTVDDVNTTLQEIEGIDLGGGETSADAPPANQ